MKKSIFSKVAAGVMAGAMVLGMTVTAFAADSLVTVTDQEQVKHAGDAINFVIDTTDMTEQDRASIASAECYITLDTDYLNGGAGYNKNGAPDGWTNCIPAEVQEWGQWELTESGVVSLPIEDYALSENGSDSLQIQFWWTNGAFSLDKIELKDESGEVLKTMVPADEYFVSGNFNSWADASMEKGDDGTYSLTLTDVAKGTLQFKVKTASWNYSWDLVGFAYGAEGNAEAEVENDGSTVVITFDGEKASVTVTAPTEGDIEEPTEGDTEEPTEGDTEGTTEGDANAPENNGNPGGGDSAPIALIAALAFAGVASVAAAVSKKTGVTEK